MEDNIQQLQRQIDNLTGRLNEFEVKYNKNNFTLETRFPGDVKVSGGLAHGRTTSDKLGFYGTTPIVRPTDADLNYVDPNNITQTNPYGWASGDNLDDFIKLVNQIRKTLNDMGLFPPTS